MDKARQLREERKGGVGSSSSSNVFKNVGQDFVHNRQGSTNSRTQISQAGPETTATSKMSSPGNNRNMGYEHFSNGLGPN